MPRQVFAGGSDDYNESVGWDPRRGGMNLGRNRRRRRRLPTAPWERNLYDDTNDPDEDPFSFDPASGKEEGLPETPTPTQPQPPNPIGYQDYVSEYTLPAGRFENMFGDLLASQGTRLTNAPAVPTFEQMFEQFRKAQRYTQDQEVAGLGEAFGSRGARYGSDILQAQTNARSRFADEASVRANEFQMGLEGQRQNFLNSLMGGYSGAASLEEGRRALGEQRAFADFIRQTSPPPVLGAAVGYAGSNSPTSIVY